MELSSLTVIGSTLPLKIDFLKNIVMFRALLLLFPSAPSVIASYLDRFLLDLRTRPCVILSRSTSGRCWVRVGLLRYSHAAFHLSLATPIYTICCLCGRSFDGYR